jgi:thiamine kinase-like enzyme
MTIEGAVARVPGWRSASTMAITPLGGGVTNANYRVDVDGEAFVVRIWTDGVEALGVDRAHECACAIAASRLGVAPEVVHALPDDGVVVTRFAPGRSLVPGEPAPRDVIERVVRSMRRYHGGPAFPRTFSPFETVEAYLGTARAAGAPLPGDIERLRGATRDIRAALGRGRTEIRPCHNDLWGPNLIDDGDTVRVVDWEYAGMGDVCFDLANFAIYHAPTDADLAALIDAYFGGPAAAAAARVRLLEIVAELREALWYLVALRVADDTIGFREASGAHFDRCRQALADPRLTAWLAQAARG